MKNNKLLYGHGRTMFDFSTIAFPINGFSKIDDYLYAQACFFENTERLLFISLEITSLMQDIVIEIKKEICKKYDFKEENIWIGVTHTFCAPHPSNKYKGVIEMVKKATLNSVEIAIENKQEVSIGFSTVEVFSNTNRNIETSLGWWIGKNREGFSNHEVRILKIENNKTSETVGLLINYDVQSSIMNEVKNSNGELTISNDLMGQVCKKIESYFEDEIVAMFLLGAAGDQVPISQGRDFGVMNEKIEYQINYGLGRKYLEQLSVQIADTIYAKIDKIQMEKENEIRIFHHTFHCKEKIIPVPTKNLKPSKKFDFSLTGKKIEVMIEAIIIGRTLMIGMSPEINSYFGRKIIDMAPSKQVMVCTMINGAMKYLPEKTDYENITYTAMNSLFAEESSEVFLKEIEDLYMKILQTIPSIFEEK